MTNSGHNWLNETFLVADDDASSCLLLSKILEKTGAHVKCVPNGKEALEILKKDQSVTIAIIDIHMPFLSGNEVAKRAKQYRPEVIYIAYTADVIRLDKSQSFDAEFDSILTKPVRPEKILNFVEEVLEMRKSAT